jgi:large subunit ribosomal protein L29
VSKKSDSLQSLSNMTLPQIHDHLKVTRRKLFEMRFQQATGQVPNHRQLRDVRRDIARTMTVQIQLERATTAAANAPSISTKETKVTRGKKNG